MPCSGFVTGHTGFNQRRNVRKHRRTLGPGDGEAAHAARPVLLPYFDGERTPNRPKATGVLAGLRNDVTRETLARATVSITLPALSVHTKGRYRPVASANPAT